MPLSILDRANARTGTTEAEVLTGVVERARRAERLGYRRFWVAEHHGVPGIVGSAPTLLMAAVTGATSTLRVGSGGVMLPNHQPLVVAEQAATLQALFPGRIDLGLGRSVGFTPGVRRALRQDKDARERFPADLADLLDLLGGTAQITARPQDHAATPVFVLATGQGLRWAAEAGLAVVVGGPSLFRRDRHGEHQGIARYRREFRPSRWWAEPHVVVSAGVAAAETEERARDLALPEAWAMARSRATGEFSPLEPVAAVKAMLDAGSVTARDRERVADSLATTIHGTPDRVRDEVAALVEFTGADELLVTGGMSDVDGQRGSDELVAGLFA